VWCAQAQVTCSKPQDATTASSGVIEWAATCPNVATSIHQLHFFTCLIFFSRTHIHQIFTFIMTCCKN
jgi:hypothetical protein